MRDILGWKSDEILSLVSSGLTRDGTAALASLAEVSVMLGVDPPRTEKYKMDQEFFVNMTSRLTLRNRIARSLIELSKDEFETQQHILRVEQLNQKLQLDLDSVRKSLNEYQRYLALQPDKNHSPSLKRERSEK